MMTNRSRTRFAAFAAAGILAILAIVAAVLTPTSSDDQAADITTPRGPAAPDSEFTRFDGSTATFADYAGEPLVVNFWASWCPSCVAEMSAAFRPVQQQVGDRVAFLGLNIQDERSRALQLVDETGVLFDLAEDPTGDLYVALGGIAMPFTVFIDEHGSITHTHNGPVTDQQLLDLIEEHLLS